MMAVKLLLVEWSGYWNLDQEHEELEWPDDLGERPARPSVEQARQALATFKEVTSLSFDNLHPRHLLALDDDGIECLLDVIEFVERVATWPRAINKMVFIGKREGGVRPIALIVSVLRVWAKLRRDVAQTWEAAHASEVF